RFRLPDDARIVGADAGTIRLSAQRLLDGREQRSAARLLSLIDSSEIDQQRATVAVPNNGDVRLLIDAHARNAAGDPDHVRNVLVTQGEGADHRRTARHLDDDESVFEAGDEEVVLVGVLARERAALALRVVAAVDVPMELPGLREVIEGLVSRGG